MEAEHCTAVPNRAGIHGAKLAVTFLPVGQLAVFQTSEFRKRQDVASDHAPCRDQVHILRPSSVLLDTPAVRKLVAESCMQFEALQEHGGAAVQRTSESYRAALITCVQELTRDRAREKSDESRAAYEQNIAVFNSLAVIFHLSEILYLESKPGHLLLPRLLDWLRLGMPLKSQVDRLREKMDAAPGSPAECHAEFWPLVRSLVMQGLAKDAEKLLAWHSHYRSSPAFMSLSKLLLAMPLLKGNNTSGIMEFSVRWKAWQKEVNTQLELGTYSHNPHLRDVAELLAGHENAEKLVYEASEHWYQHLVTHLLYHEPTVQAFQLSEFSERFKRMYHVKGERAFDRILTALFESDVLQMLKDLKEFSESGWAAVHLTDLLFHAGRLSKLDMHDQRFRSVGTDLREHFIVEYAELLLSDASMWNLGMFYLDHCPTYGKAVISLVAPTLVPTTSTLELVKLLYELKKRDLEDIADQICTVKARDYLRTQQLGHALVWAVRARDAVLCSAIADAMLREFCHTNTFRYSDVIDNLGTAVLLCDRLSFLGKYSQMRERTKQNRFKEASRILMDLATSGFTPSYFVPLLLEDALPLIEMSDHKTFSSDDLYSLLAVLEELRSSLDSMDLQDKCDTKQALASHEQNIRKRLIKKIGNTELDEISALLNQ